MKIVLVSLGFLLVCSLGESRPAQEKVVESKSHSSFSFSSSYSSSINDGKVVKEYVNIVLWFCFEIPITPTFSAEVTALPRELMESSQRPAKKSTSKTLPRSVKPDLKLLGRIV